VHEGVFILVKKGEFMKKIKKFLSEVKSELGKVKWPNRKDMIKYSIATIIFVIFFAGFFYLIDLAVAFVKTLV
jgi:preprotein translocase subunit SecE